VKRVCYDCRKELTLEETIKGQIELDKKDEQARKEGWEFEGWVHCQGMPEQFIRGEDNKLKMELEKRGLFFEGGIIVCKECVCKQFELERENVVNI